MQVDIVGSATWHEVISGPSAGARARSDVIAMGQLLLENTKFLNEELDGALILLERVSTSDQTRQMLRNIEDFTSWRAARVTAEGAEIVVTLANTIAIGDIIITNARLLARVDVSDSPIDKGLQIALSGPGFSSLPNSTIKVVSSTIEMVIPVEFSTCVRITSLAGATQETKIWGACITATGNVEAELRGPYSLAVSHFRPFVKG